MLNARLPAGLGEILHPPGRALALIILGLLVLVRVYDPGGFLKAIALRGFDREQLVAPRAYQPLSVRIVAIDEKSLSRYGQWPWPRTLVAKLVHRIAAGHPRALGSTPNGSAGPQGIGSAPTLLTPLSLRTPAPAGTTTLTATVTSGGVGWGNVSARRPASSRNSVTSTGSAMAMRMTEMSWA